MAGITTIGYRTSGLTLHDLLLFSLSRLRTHPLTQPLVPEMEALRPDLEGARVEELSLIETEYDADAAIKLLDEDLDAIVDALVSVLRIELGGNTNSPIYLRYFGSRRPSELRRPVLGNQLETMRAWPPSLIESSNPVMQQYGATLLQKIIEADAAVGAKQRVTQQLTDFRATGTRARFIDRFNAVRKTVYGRLGEIQHAHKSLGSGWAESFFRSGGGSERVTLTELERKIAAAEAELTALRAERDKLAAEEDRVTQARADAERAEKRERIDAARAAVDELNAEIADLEADME